jgi:hypothetical protein
MKQPADRFLAGQIPPQFSPQLPARVYVQLPDPRSIAKSMNDTEEEQPVMFADHEIQEIVMKQLNKLGTWSCRSIKLAVLNGEVFVSGSVHTESERLLVVHLIERLLIVKGVFESLDVRNPTGVLEKSRYNIHELWANGKIVMGVVVVIMAIFFWGYKPQDNAIVLQPFPVVVKYRGEKIPGAYLTLHPVPVTLMNNSVKPIGNVRGDGQVIWSTFHTDDGLPAGEYVVTVTWYRPIKTESEVRPGPNVIPAKYSHPTSTPLRVMVQENVIPEEPFVIEFK